MVLVLLVLVQVVTHLGWLSIAAVSGQMVEPWLLARGGVYFETLIENRPPALPVVLAFIQQFVPADPVLTVRALNLLLVCTVTLLVFIAGKKLLNPLAGLLAGGVWFLFEPVYGNVLLYYDSVLGLVFLAALLLWWGLADRRPVWLAPLLMGLLLGGTTLIKQHAWAMVVVFGLWLLFTSRRRLADLTVYALGALIFPAALVLIVTAQGTLDSYLFWNWGMNFGTVRPGNSLSGEFVRKVLLTVALVPVFLALYPRYLPRRKASLLLVMWLGAAATLVPTFGEAYVMAQLPLVVVMSGAVLALLAREMLTAGPTIARQALLGFLAVLLIGWGWMAASAYAPGVIGRAQSPAYDEFRPVAQQLDQLALEGDTLFVLPELDGSAQLHVLTGLEPPGTWSHGHAWFFAVEGLAGRLMSEWEADPPTFIVNFPDMTERSMPYIGPFVDFMRAHYTLVGQVDDVLFNGDAEIWRLDTP